MKRCPQCEFIYEDDQNCCDMDGVSLLHTQMTPAPPLHKSPKRNGSRRSLLSVFGVVRVVLVLRLHMPRWNAPSREFRTCVRQ